MSLQSRLRKLERGGGKPCPECGFDGTWTDYEVVWQYDGEGEDEGPKETAYCEVCRRPVHIVLTGADI
jgi:hypothetical protein